MIDVTFSRAMSNIQHNSRLLAKMVLGEKFAR